MALSDSSSHLCDSQHRVDLVVLDVLLQKNGNSYESNQNPSSGIGSCL